MGGDESLVLVRNGKVVYVWSSGEIGNRFKSDSANADQQWRRGSTLLSVKGCGGRVPFDMMVMDIPLSAGYLFRIKNVRKYTRKNQKTWNTQE